MTPLSLSGPITFSITQNRIDVRAGAILFAMEPVIDFAIGSKPKVLAAGVGRPPVEPHLRVRLFDSGSPLPTGVSKVEALDRFFRYALKQIVDRHFFRTKPDIRVVGAESLEAVMGGYQEVVLSKALEGASARRLTFARQDQAGTS